MTSMYEPVATTDLARLLQGMTGPATVEPEPTGVFPGGRRPDILITAQGRSPIVIEARRMPADNLEEDAVARFKLEADIGGRGLESVIALRYPAGMPALDAATPLEYAAFTYNPANELITRFPDAGWLRGRPVDLAGFARLMSLPRAEVDAAAVELMRGIDAGAGRLGEESALRPYNTLRIAGILGMSNVPQTYRMACAIIANALAFHIRVSGMHPQIPQLHQVCGRDVLNPQGKILDAWADILRINYWPIFAVSRRILEEMYPATAAAITEFLQVAVATVNARGVDNAHGLTGRVFQNLIADRKYLAAFYTRTDSAALLARLAVAQMDGVDWGDADAIGKLRIADFACGTGALLSSVYEQIAARHEQAGGDPAGLHRNMMEDILYGGDVMPSAVHITGATLAGLQPDQGFSQSRLYVFPYGESPQGEVAIGSLELLTASAAFTSFNMHGPAQRTGGAGAELADQVIADIPHESFDLVIMNPPFTSNTKHYDSDDGVTNAAFAAFDSSEDEQLRMAERLKLLARNTCYHGHAGQGSVFAALAHNKLKPGGVLALVLPFTAINGASWAKFRQLLAENYTDLTVVSIAANGDDMSFSSETGMAECLIIGRKNGINGPNGEPNGKPKNPRAKFVSLRHRPANLAEAQEQANGILEAAETRRLEDGPYGGIPIICGDGSLGEILEAPVGSYETGWGAARIQDAEVAQVAHLLAAGRLWLPATPSAIELPMAPLEQVGRRGLDSQLFISPAHNGPFIKAPPIPTPSRPALWNHNARNETKMICTPDSEMRVRIGMELKADELWEMTSRVHLNREFTFGSQALTVAFTEQRSIGGAVWPNILFDNPAFDLAFTVWGNSTLGLLLYWWHANRQQSSKARTTIRSAAAMPILDLRSLTDAQLATARAIFRDFRNRPLQPAYLADADRNRARLDRRVVCELLGLGEEVYQGVRRLAAKWCAEPSVHGGKQRPRRARYVE